MLAIRNSLSTWGRLVPVLVIAVSFIGCATKEPEPLIADESGRRESALPWNQQEKWEQSGQMGPMAEGLSPSSSR
jgi:hypothetical protein